MERETRDFLDVKSSIGNSHTQILTEEDEFLNQIESDSVNLESFKTQVLTELHDLTSNQNILGDLKVEQEDVDLKNQHSAQTHDNTVDYKTTLFSRSVDNKDRVIMDLEAQIQLLETNIDNMG